MVTDLAARHYRGSDLVLEAAFADLGIDRIRRNTGSIQP
jgi:hypothetical protein